MPFDSNSAKAAVHRSWANTHDRTARVAPGLAAQRRLLEQEADPDGVMTPKNRAKAAENLYRAKQLERSAKGIAAIKAKAALRQKKDADAAEKAGEVDA